MVRFKVRHSKEPEMMLKDALAHCAEALYTRPR
jgi:hypothetical protein